MGEISRVADTYIEKFIKFMKISHATDLNGFSVGGALQNMTSPEIKAEFIKWLEAGEPDHGVETK